MTPERTLGPRNRADRPPTGLGPLITVVVGLFLLATVLAGPALGGDPSTDRRTADAQAVEPGHLAATGPNEGSASIAVKKRPDGTVLSTSRKVAAIAPEAADSPPGIDESPRLECVGQERTGSGITATDTARHVTTRLSEPTERIGPLPAGSTDGPIPSTGEDGLATPGSVVTDHRSSASDVASQPDLSDPVAEISAPAPQGQTGDGGHSVILLASIVLSALLGLFVVARRLGRGSLSGLSGSLRTLVSPGASPGVNVSKEDETVDAPMTDRELVHRLLVRHGGRMPQSDIVAQTEWSKAKVSRLLCEMDDADDIVKIQLGRQNLICLEGSEPELSKPLT